MLRKVILHFYFWYFTIPSHQTQIIHWKLTVIFVMVYWLLLTTNMKNPHNMHETYLKKFKTLIWIMEHSSFYQAISSFHFTLCTTWQHRFQNISLTQMLYYAL